MRRRAGQGSIGRSRRPATRRPGVLARHVRRPFLVLVVVLIVGVGAVVLERAGVLPEPGVEVVRQLEAWLAPMLRNVGLELPPSRTQGTPGSSEIADDRAAVAQALLLLNRVPVRAEQPRGYQREDWRHWIDEDGDCVDTRDEVLAAESIAAVVWSADGCDVVGGLWRDAYTGEVYRDPDDLDVDHFVPLAEAHRSGGHAWSQDRRAAFANDLDDARALIAVSASVNRSKSDQGPDDWLPPDPAYHCRYAADWVAVKVRWSLAMDERERVAVGNLLGACAGR